jgi:hypothetical protein
MPIGGKLRMNIRVLAFGVALGLAAFSNARAQEILFRVSGAGGGPSATFKLPQNPSPDFVDPDVYFGFFSVQATIDGSPSNLFGLSFFNSGDGGGLADDSYYDLTGPQLYVGPESSPTFVPGVYVMYNTLTLNADTLTLTIIPEPSTWAMILAGFSSLGLVGVRRANRGASRIAVQNG